VLENLFLHTYDVMFMRGCIGRTTLLVSAGRGADPDIDYSTSACGHVCVRAYGKGIVGWGRGTGDRMERLINLHLLQTESRGHRLYLCLLCPPAHKVGLVAQRVREKICFGHHALPPA